MKIISSDFKAIFGGQGSVFDNGISASCVKAIANTAKKIMSSPNSPKENREAYSKAMHAACTLEETFFFLGLEALDNI